MASTSKALNKAALINLYNIGGKELVARMIDRFVESAPERVSSARLHANRNDLRTLHLIAHSLKASAGNVGVDRFRDLVERLEEACLDRPDAVEGLVGDLEGRLGEATEQLRNERTQWT
jgi:HPt (histidine-containing phosphotransfer) domain-containing protein